MRHAVAASWPVSSMRNRIDSPSRRTVSSACFFLRIFAAGQGKREEKSNLDQRRRVFHKNSRRRNFIILRRNSNFLMNFSKKSKFCKENPLTSGKSWCMILNCLNMRSLRLFRKWVWQNAQKSERNFSHFLQRKTPEKPQKNRQNTGKSVWLSNHFTPPGRWGETF